MQAEHEKHHVPKSVESSLDSIDIKRGWSAEDLQRIAAATEQEMYDVLRPAKGSVLRSRLRTLTDYGRIQGDPVCGQVYAKALAVLERLAAENEVNALRLRPYLPAKPPVEGAAAPARPADDPQM